LLVITNWPHCRYSSPPRKSQKQTNSRLISGQKYLPRGQSTAKKGHILLSTQLGSICIKVFWWFHLRQPLPLAANQQGKRPTRYDIMTLTFPSSKTLKAHIHLLSWRSFGHVNKIFPTKN
jgi:hypothetical protein